MTDFQKELDEIRKIRQAKHSGLTSDLEKAKQVKPEYNYDIRKDTLDYIKKCSKSEVMKERMDKIEKTQYQNIISKLSIEDIENFSPHELNTNFMIDLFKYNFNPEVLSYSYLKYGLEPHILMIKEVISKPKIPETYILKLVQDYAISNKNTIPIITNTNLFDSNFEQAKEFVMELFYSDSNTPSISYSQLKFIYDKTNVNPEQFRFLVAKCSNKSAYSKCSKTYVERSNKDLIKNLIHEMESKYKCKLKIDLYD
jgi:hypothetical protein